VIELSRRVAARTDQMRSVKVRGMTLEPVYPAACSPSCEKIGAYWRAMRWMVFCCGLLLCGEASAVKLTVKPTIAQKCRSARTWGGLTSCFARHGSAKVVRTHKGARLVRWTDNTGGADMMLLYVERKEGWQLGGQARPYNRNVQLLAFEPVTVGTRTGYRIEIGRAEPLALVIDGISTVAAELRTKQSLFCSGDGPFCANATSSCEVLVRGKARFAFRGTLAIEGDTVHVRGDRSKAGEHCQFADTVLMDRW
jgi:hypothetical protein